MTSLKSNKTFAIGDRVQCKKNPSQLGTVTRQNFGYHYVEWDSFAKFGASPDPRTAKTIKKAKA